MKTDDYLEFFKNATNTDIAGEWITGEDMFPHVKYHQTVRDFLNDFYDAYDLDHHYLENYEDIKNREIDQLTRNELLTLLTYIIRSEKFFEGALLEEINNGTVYCILLQLDSK